MLDAVRNTGRVCRKICCGIVAVELGDTEKLIVPIGDHRRPRVLIRDFEIGESTLAQHLADVKYRRRGIGYMFYNIVAGNDVKGIQERHDVVSFRDVLEIGRKRETCVAEIMVSEAKKLLIQVDAYRLGSAFGQRDQKAPIGATDVERPLASQRN